MSEGRLNGRVAVVTGAGNGIGEATAVRFAEEGAAVVVADLLEDPARTTVEEIESNGGRACAVRVDVTNRADNDTMVAAALEQYGRLDVLVTAAGVSHADYVSGETEGDVKLLARRHDYAERPGWDFVEQELDEWNKVISINLTGTLLGMQAAAAPMIESGGGSIVTIASVAAKHPDAGPLSYTVSKAGVWMLTKKAARMLGPVGVRVNSIGPGFITTNMTRLIDMMSTEETEGFYENIPLRRRGAPIEIANTALFLASDESSYFTGEILHPDGGYFTE